MGSKSEWIAKVERSTIYIKGYQTMRQAQSGIVECTEFYNLLSFLESHDYKIRYLLSKGHYQAKELILQKKAL